MADWIFARLTEGRHEEAFGCHPPPPVEAWRRPFWPSGHLRWRFGVLCGLRGVAGAPPRPSLALRPPGVPTGLSGFRRSGALCAGLRIWWGLRFCAQKRVDRDPPHVSQSWTCLTARHVSQRLIVERSRARQPVSEWDRPKQIHVSLWPCLTLLHVGHTAPYTYGGEWCRECSQRAVKGTQYRG
jgi:hypothetical protein